MTKVKICGITNLEDALMSIDAGADMLGFNFYRASPRYVAPQSATAILKLLPAEIGKVGVFVNSSLAELESISSDVSLDFIQLHGDESPDFLSRLANSTDAKVIKAIRVSPDFRPSMAVEFQADLFLLDTDSRTFGGSGETFDWDAAIRFKELIPEFFLAGGLTPENVEDAIRRVMPFAVDVCSGVESVRGRKDPSKVAAFIRNVKSAL